MVQAGLFAAAIGGVFRRPRLDGRISISTAASRSRRPHLDLDGCISISTAASCRREPQPGVDRKDESCFIIE
jgi:hypothetical protein